MQGCPDTNQIGLVIHKGCLDHSQQHSPANLICNKEIAARKGYEIGIPICRDVAVIDWKLYRRRDG
jgi:hypothetical protein